MIELGAHFQFIIWAYAGVAVTVAGLVGWTIRDARIQQRRLSDLEARGIRRRTTPPETTA